MEELLLEKFNGLGRYPKALSLKYLEVGKYDLISLRKALTKKGPRTIAKLKVKGNEQEYFLAKRHGELSDIAIDGINRAIDEIDSGVYQFDYRGLVDGRYEYTLEKKLDWAQ